MQHAVGPVAVAVSDVFRVVWFHSVPLDVGVWECDHERAVQEVLDLPGTQRSLPP